MPAPLVRGQMGLESCSGLFPCLAPGPRPDLEFRYCSCWGEGRVLQEELSALWWEEVVKHPSDPSNPGTGVLR